MTLNNKMNAGVLLSIFLFCAINVIEIECWKIFNKGRVRGGMFGGPKFEEAVDLPPDEWFEQRLDHYDPSEIRTWNQVF